MLRKYGIKLMLLMICCAFVFIAGSKVLASSSYQDGSLFNAKIILCASSPDEDQKSVIDDDNMGSQKDVDKNAVIEDDDQNAQKDVDKNAIIDDDSKDKDSSK